MQTNIGYMLGDENVTQLLKLVTQISCCAFYRTLHNGSLYCQCSTCMCSYTGDDGALHVDTSSIVKIT